LYEASCRECRFYDEDFDTGYKECVNEDVNEALISVFFMEGGEGCVGFSPRKDKK
jgi:hypothetical protein